MKHIINILLIVSKFLLTLFFMLLGFLILPIMVLFRKPTINLEKESNQEKFSCPVIDFIYGNKYDGFGDKYYRRDFPIDTYWSRLNWCLLRNPVHNLSIFLGVNKKIIIKSVITGNPDVTDDPFEKNEGLKFQEVWDIDNNYYPMYYYCKLWRNIIPFNLYKGDRGFRLLMGYKNFCVNDLNKVYSYGSVCVITPFKKFVQG